MQHPPDIFIEQNRKPDVWAVLQAEHPAALSPLRRIYGNLFRPDQIDRSCRDRPGQRNAPS